MFQALMISFISHLIRIYTAQTMKFSIKDFFSSDQIRRKLRIWSHLLKTPLMENINFLWSDNQSFLVF